jgi:hypothetical protein
VCPPSERVSPWPIVGRTSTYTSRQSAGGEPEGDDAAHTAAAIRPFDLLTLSRRPRRRFTGPGAVGCGALTAASASATAS